MGVSKVPVRSASRVHSVTAFATRKSHQVAEISSVKE